MKWVLIVVGLLLVLICAVVIVGLLLPKLHVASRRAKYNRPAEEVWEVISDLLTHAEWRRGVIEMKRVEDQGDKAVWKEVRRRGDSISYLVEESEPPRKLVTRIVNNRQFGGTWTWEIEPVDENQCMFRITERGEIYNPIFRIVARYFMGYTGVMDTCLTDLAAKYGDPVEFVE